MELLAVDRNSEAYRIGFTVGQMTAMLLPGLIALIAGMKHDRPILAIFGMIVSGTAGSLLGCCGGIPVCFVFVLIFIALGSPPKQQVHHEPMDTYRRALGSPPRQQDHDDSTDPYKHEQW